MGHHDRTSSSYNLKRRSFAMGHHDRTSSSYNLKRRSFAMETIGGLCSFSFSFMLRLYHLDMTPPFYIPEC